MRHEVASQVHLQPGPAAAGACRGQAYCLFVWGPPGRGVARHGPALLTVSLASLAEWHLLWEGLGKEKEAMSGVGPAICRGLSPGCSSFRGPVKTMTQKELRIFGLTSSTELPQKPELLGVQNAELKTGSSMVPATACSKHTPCRGGTCAQAHTPTHTPH